MTNPSSNPMQCDGCNLGLPIDEKGNHLRDGAVFGIHQTCTNAAANLPPSPETEAAVEQSTMEERVPRILADAHIATRHIRQQEGGDGYHCVDCKRPLDFCKCRASSPAEQPKPAERVELPLDNVKEWRKAWSHKPTPIPPDATGLWYSEECVDQMLSDYSTAALNENKELREKLAELTAPDEPAVGE